MVLHCPVGLNKTSTRLDASVGASGPHDFAVRESISRLRAGYRSQVSSTRPAIPSRARRCRVHRIPYPTSVTIAKRPSVWDGMLGVLALQLLCWEMSESMGNHDSKIVDAGSVD